MLACPSRCLGLGTMLSRRGGYAHVPARQGCGRKGHRRIMLRTVDTDVVVLAVSTVVSMENTQLWIAFGTGKHLRYIPAHEIATSLGAEKAQTLPMFHAFTGCDTVSSFAGKGKKTAFDTWRSFNAATEVFARLVSRPTSLGNVCMSVLESYVVLMYDRGSDETTVDSARKHMFTSKARYIEPFHQPELHCCSMQDERHTRVAIYGVRLRFEIQIFLLQSPGDGAGIRREDGTRCGRYSQKRPCPARSC